MHPVVLRRQKCPRYRNVKQTLQYEFNLNFQLGNWGIFKSLILLLFTHADPLVFESVILSANDNVTLKSWIGCDSFTAKLCWRATRDGWSASTFHSNCDNKKPTVTVVKVDQYVFGGYATESWEGEINQI